MKFLNHHFIPIILILLMGSYLSYTLFSTQIQQEVVLNKALLNEVHQSWKDYKEWHENNAYSTERQLNNHILGVDEFKMLSASAKMIIEAHDLMERNINDIYHSSLPQLKKTWLRRLQDDLNKTHQVMLEAVNNDTLLSPIILDKSILDLQKKEFKAALNQLSIDLSIWKTTALNSLIPSSKKVVNGGVLQPMILAKKNIINIGETYKAEIFLTEKFNNDKDISIAINGKRLMPSNGVANYQLSTKKLGERKYSVNMILKNSITGDRLSYKKDYSYIVNSCK